MRTNAGVTLYGIPNCGTVRAARAWLAEAGVSYRFHDFKKEGIDLPSLTRWQEALGWEAVLNRRGTTWRGLPDALRGAIVDAPSAAELMAEQTSLIKRPVLEVAGHVCAGFSPEAFTALLHSSPHH